MEEKPKGEPQPQEVANPGNHALSPIPDEEKTCGGRTQVATNPRSLDTTEQPQTRWRRFRVWVWPMEFSDAVMILLTAFIAFGTIVSAIAIGFQWHEMHSGGADTKSIADAAQKQVYAANRSADAAQLFANTAGDINRSVNDAVGKLNLQAGAAQTSADTSKRILDLEVALDKASLSALNPEAFENGVFTQLRFSLQNTGRTPATHVRYYLYPNRYTRSWVPNDVIRNIGETFAKIPTSGSMNPGIGNNWSDLPDIPGSTATGITVTYSGPIGALTLDYVSYWAGRVEYVDFLGNRQGKEFCVQLVVQGIRPNAYQPGYCPIQETGYYKDPKQKD